MDACDIQIRTGVNSSELCGRTWKSLEASIKRLHHSSSVSSLDSMSNISQRCLSVSTCTSDSVSLDGRTQSFRKISTDSAVSCPTLNRQNDILPTDLSESSEHFLGYSSGDINSDIYQRNLDDRTLSYCDIDVSLNIDVPDIAWHSPMEAMDNISHRENFWVWVSATGCAVDSESLPNWFCEGDYYFLCM